MADTMTFILEYLEKNHFSKAAAALRSEISSRPTNAAALTRADSSDMDVALFLRLKQEAALSPDAVNPAPNMTVVSYDGFSSHAESREKRDRSFSLDIHQVQDHSSPPSIIAPSRSHPLSPISQAGSSPRLDPIPEAEVLDTEDSLSKRGGISIQPLTMASPVIASPVVAHSVIVEPVVAPPVVAHAPLLLSPVTAASVMGSPFVAPDPTPDATQMPLEIPQLKPVRLAPSVQQTAAETPPPPAAAAAAVTTVSPQSSSMQSTRSSNEDLQLSPAPSNEDFNSQLSSLPVVSFGPVVVGSHVASGEEGLGMRRSRGSVSQISASDMEDAHSAVSLSTDGAAGLSEGPWDGSDMYEDEEDVGYVRQLIEDEEWFMLNEVNAPSAEEDSKEKGLEEDGKEEGKEEEAGKDVDGTEGTAGESEQVETLKEGPGEEAYFSGEEYYKLGVLQKSGEVVEEEKVEDAESESTWDGLLDQLGRRKLEAQARGRVGGREDDDDDDNVQLDVRSIGVTSDIADAGSSIRELGSECDVESVKALPHRTKSGGLVEVDERDEEDEEQEMIGEDDNAEDAVMSDGGSEKSGKPRAFAELQEDTVIDLSDKGIADDSEYYKRRSSKKQTEGGLQKQSSDPELKSSGNPSVSPSLSAGATESRQAQDGVGFGGFFAASGGEGFSFPSPSSNDGLSRTVSGRSMWSVGDLPTQSSIGVDMMDDLEGTAADDTLASWKRRSGSSSPIVAADATLQRGMSLDDAGSFSGDLEAERRVQEAEVTALCEMVGAELAKDKGELAEEKPEVANDHLELAKGSSELASDGIGLPKTKAEVALGEAKNDVAREHPGGILSGDEDELLGITQAEGDHGRQVESEVTLSVEETAKGKDGEAEKEIQGQEPSQEQVAGDGEVEVAEEMDSNKKADAEEEFETFNLKIIHRKNRTGFEEEKDFPVVLNSVVAGRYYVTEYLGSAAFSKAIQAHDLFTGMDVCMKIIKNNKDFFDQSLDEIKLLKFINKHDPADDHHLLRLYDYFYHREHLFIICELLRANLYEFHKYNRESGGEVYFTMPRLQSIAKQILEALKFMHSLGLIHCDLKPENILVKSYSRCEVKVIDLGSSCFETDHLCSYVQSRSYRAPEVILGLPYGPKIDIWSLGCIMAELCSGQVLFQNDSLATLLARVVGIIGPIDPKLLEKGRDTHKYFTKSRVLYERNPETDQLEYLVPKKTSLKYRLPMGDGPFVEFVAYLLQVDPSKRPSAAEALQHPWFSQPYDAP